VQEINEIQKPLKSVGDNSHFWKKINEVYRQNTGKTDAKAHDYQKFLLQYFWINQAKYLDGFLPVLARHIYPLSFPKD